MAYPVPVNWLGDVLAPLGAAFGERLIFSHDGPVARWSFDGNAAIVELGRADRVTASFVARPEVDAVTGRPSAPVYMVEADGYPLTRVGCERMVTDMVAFFSGIREPRFTFVAAR